MPALTRTLRPRDLLLLFIGSVIGSGIFLTPGLILRQLNGSVGAASLVWIVGGVLSLLGALTYAELSATNPEAGGLYCFIRDGFGRIPAFLYGWSLFLVIASGTIAALAHAFTRYLSEVIPIPSVATKPIAVLMIAIVTAVNVWGTRKSANLQNWTTLVKASLVVLLSAVLLTLGHHAHELPAALPATQQGSALLSSFGLAMIAVLWAYEGWQFGTYSAGEVIDPQKSFPRAFLIGSLILVALYLTANVAYLIALGPKAATASDAIAATAASTVLGPWAGKFIALTILISVFSSTNSVILTAPRVFYAMANDNLFFKKLAEVHPRYGTPAAAVIALGFWSAILACAGKFAELIGGVIFIGWIFYGLGAAAIFPLRRKSQNKSATGGAPPIPYRVPGYPFTPFIFVLAAAAIVANAIILAFYDPASFQHILAAIVIFLLGIPAYYFWRRRSFT
jgi:APA family basic amino acid/polyamine antiporter